MLFFLVGIGNIAAATAVLYVVHVTSSAVLSLGVVV